MAGRLPRTPLSLFFKNKGGPGPRPGRVRAAARPLILAGCGLLYPGLVFFTLDRIPPGALVLTALVLVAARLGLLRDSPLAAALSLPLGLVFLATALLGLAGAEEAALAYPMLMSLGMAAAFAWSLRQPTCLVEHFAALTEPDPSPAARAYMRKVTLAWTLVLTGNALCSAATIVSGDRTLWVGYNGGVSYLILGGTAGLEGLIRRRVKAGKTAPPERDGPGSQPKRTLTIS